MRLLLLSITACGAAPLIRPDLSDTRLEIDVHRSVPSGRGAAKTIPPTPPNPSAAATGVRTPPQPDRPDDLGTDAKRRKRRANPFWTVSIAACVVLIAAAAGPLQYHAVVRFQVAGSFDRCRRELLDLLWMRERAGLLEHGWALVPRPQASALEVRTSATDTERARSQIDAVESGFAERLARLNREAAGRNHETRTLLARAVDDFKDTVRRARRDLTAARQALPPGDLTPRREANRTSSLAQTQLFRTLRQQEQDLLAAIDRFEARPPEPKVDPEDAEAAYAARADLQQDLQQLRVQLTLGRRHLEDVWQTASPRLDDLLAATAAVVRIGSGAAARAAAPDCRRRLDALIDKVKVYQQRLKVFAEKWTRTLVTMRLEPIDPKTPRLFAVQERLQTLLGEFTFHSDKLMEDMRDRVRSLDPQSARQSRNHQLVSQATRSFQRFETDHRQFEFNASDVFRRNNFRLDSAVKSARGLHRRIRDNIAAIDRRLETEALDRARKERQVEIDTARRQLRDVREAIYTAVEGILAWQADLAAAIPEHDRYVRAAWIVEAAEHRLTEAERELLEWQKLLQSYENDRQAGVQASYAIRRTERAVDPTPSNLPRRVTIATAAGVLTFVTLTAFGRRRRNTPWP